MNSAPRYDVDVAVIGAGIAGLAACVFLRQHGLRVVCLDARPYPHHKVGESLDWSSPGLLRRLGIDVKSLIADGIATYKRNTSFTKSANPSGSSRLRHRLAGGRCVWSRGIVRSLVGSHDAADRLGEITPAAALPDSQC